MSIKLSDISIMDLTHGVYGWPKTSKEDQPIIEFLSKHNITNYKELEDVLNSDISEQVDYFVLLTLRNQLATAKNKIFDANCYSKNVPKIFTFDTPQIFGIDDNTIHITDTKNNCSVLPYAHPFAYGAVLNRLESISIEEAKKLLSTCYINGDYKLSNSITCKRHIGPTKATEIAELIKFYNEQVVRQKIAHKDARDCDLFGLDRSFKMVRVTEQLKDIVEYLFDEANELICGKLTKTSKEKIASASISTRGEDIQRTRTNLILMLANYTTLEELETGILTPQPTVRIENGTLIEETGRPIDRFIKVRK